MRNHKLLAIFASLSVVCASQAAIIDVAIQNFAFSPNMVNILQGDTVRWTNLDFAPHTATAAGGAFNSGTLGNGQSFSFTFNDVGTYDYSCRIHTHMMGTVHVAPVPEPGSILAIGTGLGLLIFRRKRSRP